MALKRKPVTGMKDILPGEMEIRDYVISLIKETYIYGTSSILKSLAWGSIKESWL